MSPPLLVEGQRADLGDRRPDRDQAVAGKDQPVPARRGRGVRVFAVDGHRPRAANLAVAALRKRPGLRRGEGQKQLRRQRRDRHEPLLRRNCDVAAVVALNRATDFPVGADPLRQLHQEAVRVETGRPELIGVDRHLVGVEHAVDEQPPLAGAAVPLGVQHDLAPVPPADHRLGSSRLEHDRVGRATGDAGVATDRSPAEIPHAIGLELEREKAGAVPNEQAVVVFRRRGGPHAAQRSNPEPQPILVAVAGADRGVGVDAQGGGHVLQRAEHAGRRRPWRDVARRRVSHARLRSEVRVAGLRAGDLRDGTHFATFATRKLERFEARCGSSLLTRVQ